MNKRIAFVVLTACLLSVQPASALQFGADLYLNVAEEYNDNVLLTKNDKITDYITRISPGLDLSMQGARLELHLGYAPTFNLYARESDLNDTSDSLYLNGRYTASERTTFTASANYVKSNNILDLQGIVGLGPIKRRAEITTYTINGNVTHNLTDRLALALGASYSDSDSDDPENDDVKTSSGNAGLTYTFSPATSFSANASYSSYNYERSSDSTSQAYTLGVSHKISPTLAVGVTGGIALTRNEDTGKTDSGFTGGVTISKTLENGSANLSYNAGISPSTQAGETLQYHGVNVSLTRRLGERLNGSAYANYTIYKSLEGAPTETDTASISAGANISYTLTPWAGLSLTYSYINFNDKIDNANDHTNNIVILALRLSYSARPGGQP